MNLKNFKLSSKGLYWGLIITFTILYLCVGFVSTLHSITFFNLANNLGLAILLGLTYEIGQASVLFSILLTKNKEKFLPWALMFLLTALQISANVYASFKFMVSGGSTDWQYWQKSILFGVQASSPEMYQVIISWISGALLPIVALGMTALVAQNIKLATEEDDKKPELPPLPPEPEPESKPKDIQQLPAIPADIFSMTSQPPAAAYQMVESTQPELIAEKLKEEYDRLSKVQAGSTTISKKDQSLKKEAEELIEAASSIKKLEIEELVSAAKNISEQEIKDDLNKEVERLTPIKSSITSDEFKNIKGLAEIQSEEQQLIDTFKNDHFAPITVPLSEKINAVITEEKVVDLPSMGIDVEAEMSKLLEIPQIEKDLIVEPEKKKRGRPPKVEVDVVTPKKEQESLQNEEVKVPEKRTRIVNPLNKKEEKPQVIKRIEQISSPSKGEVLIQSLENESKVDVINTIIEELPVVEPSTNEPVGINNVEVVDVKAVPIKKNLT